MKISGTLATFAAALLISSCSTMSGGLSANKGEQSLDLGIKSYEKGDYINATKALQNAITLSQATKDGLGPDALKPNDLVKAHKYLAFTYCVMDKERLCRSEFKEALDLNPNFDLEPSEAGHPIWGPIFKSVKYPPKPVAAPAATTPTKKKTKKSK